MRLCWAGSKPISLARCYCNRSNGRPCTAARTAQPSHRSRHPNSAKRSFGSPSSAATWVAKTTIPPVLLSSGAASSFCTKSPKCIGSSRKTSKPPEVVGKGKRKRERGANNQPVSALRLLRILPPHLRHRPRTLAGVQRLRRRRSAIHHALHDPLQDAG